MTKHLVPLHRPIDLDETSSLLSSQVFMTFEPKWRYKPPRNGEFVTQTIPPNAVDEFLSLIRQASAQMDPQAIFEHFKRRFLLSAGQPYNRSSNVSWAETDLSVAMTNAAKHAPLFIEALCDAFRFLPILNANLPGPDDYVLNEILVRNDVGYRIDGQFLRLRGDESKLVDVPAEELSDAQRAQDILQRSLARSEELLEQGADREAVQESLWFLETVSTAFRGIEHDDTTFRGKYFNTIAKEVKSAGDGPTAEFIMDLSLKVHGYLSSPSGGGVRHGADLKESVPLSASQARLFCNLIRSFAGFLIAEYRRLKP